MNLSDLATPAAVIDDARMMQNIARMQHRLDALGVRLRPHVKTSKCLAVAQRQMAAGAHGITVSTLAEAEQFFAAGFSDILYAVCIAPHKLARVLALRRRGCALRILVDSVVAATAVVDFGRAHAHVFEVMIEVDSDGHRSGVLPDGDDLIAVGRVLADGARLCGVMTHAGSSYDADAPEALRAVAEQERARTVRAAERLRAAGLPCPEVSVGSTPTALSAVDLAGVTEVRAGVYVFFDLVMANIGVCALADIALSVLTTVIGHNVQNGWVVVDAGWMAMSRDRGTARQRVDYGYGAVCDLDGHRVDQLAFAGANQEHGLLAARAPPLAERWPIGTRLRILPNHACATAAQFSAYHVVAGSRAVTDRWARFGGW